MEKVGGLGEGRGWEGVGEGGMVWKGVNILFIIGTLRRGLGWNFMHN